MVAPTNPQRMPHEVAIICERIAKNLVRHKFANAVLTLSLEEMDVVAAGLRGASKAWLRYDESFQVQPQTFLYLPIMSAMKDYFRAEGAAQTRTKKIRRALGDDVSVGDEPEVPDWELCDWLKGVYEAAKEAYPENPHKRGPRKYGAPRLVAIAALMKRESLNSRACARLLAARSDLLAAMRMKHIPHWTWLNKAQRVSDELSAANLSTEGALAEIVKTAENGESDDSNSLLNANRQSIAQPA